MRKKIRIILIVLSILAVSAGTVIYQVIHRGHASGKINPLPVDYSTYTFRTSGKNKIIEIGSQPNSLSGSYILESLFHDRILHRYLKENGWGIRNHGYRNGNDMLPYADGRLDIMMLGDIPALLAMTRYNMGVYTLCRQGYNAVIATRRYIPSELKGLKIAYPSGTAAQFTLERALESGNLSWKDIIPVPLQPDEMKDALKNKKVDAVTVWEPFLATILSQIDGSVIISRSDTYSFITIDIEFAKKNPVLLKHILAAIIRSINWLRQDDANIRSGLGWINKSAVRFMGESPIDSSMKWISLLKNETLNNPSFPMLPFDIASDQGLHHQQFIFLKKIGKIPNDIDWRTCTDRIYSSSLPDIVRDRSAWQTDLFDYSPESLYQPSGAPE